MNNLEKYIGDLNPSCWLNADYINGINMVQPSLGASVSIWTDISGNNNHFVHEVIATYNPPVLTGTTLYNKVQNSVSFLATNKNTLWSTFSNNLWTNTYTIILVVSEFTGGSPLNHNFTGAIPGNLTYTDSAAFINSYSSISTQVTLRPFVRTNNNISIVKRANNIFTGQSVFSPSSYLTSIPSTIIGAPTVATTGVNMGGRRLSNTSYDNLLNGKICEMIVFPRILTISDTAQTQVYLQLKYNI